MAQKQLMFETALGNDRRPELYIPLNKSVEPQDAPRLSRQAKAILDRLQRSPATTSELAVISLQYSARVNECRHYLIEQDEMIDNIPGSGGENTFVIVPLSQSSFWRRVREKQECWKWLR